jgi:hypothetical protein
MVFFILGVMFKGFVNGASIIVSAVGWADDPLIP